MRAHAACLLRLVCHNLRDNHHGVPALELVSAYTPPTHELARRDVQLSDVYRVLDLHDQGWSAKVKLCGLDDIPHLESRPSRDNVILVRVVDDLHRRDRQIQGNGHTLPRLALTVRAELPPPAGLEAQLGGLWVDVVEERGRRGERCVPAQRHFLSSDVGRYHPQSRV